MTYSEQRRKEAWERKIRRGVTFIGLITIIVVAVYLAYYIAKVGFIAFGIVLAITP